MSNGETVDVLVVGAGPTGLTLASELLRHGATVRLVDQLAAPVVYSKAAVVHARTMEHFDAMGVADAMVERSRVLHGTNIFASGKRVAHVSLDGASDSPYNNAYGISQHDTEAVLASHLGRLGGTIDRGATVTSFTQDEAGVRAKVTRGSATDEVHARWIVGCDGAHSTVRKALGFAFEGAPYEEKLIQADLRISFGVHAPEDEILIFLHERGPMMAFPLFRDGRYRLILLDTSSEASTASEPAAKPDALPSTPPVPTLDDFQRGLADRNIEATVSDPAWTIAFRIHHRHVDKLRLGRAFIAGDAAHIHSPVGGQGMNTGIQDAVNLAWKLALTARGNARPSLLDSYEAERLPVIRDLVATTDRATRAMEGAVKLRSPIAVGLRNQLLSSVTRLGFVQAQASSTIKMLGITYSASPICAQERASLLHASVVSSATSEAPSVLDWAAFGSGPAPGSRALDATAQGGVGKGPVRIHELLRAGRHVALLFDGTAATEAGYANLVGIARRLQARARMDAYVIVPMAAAPAPARWEGATLLDADGEVHRAYGARSECAYVIRPDGYVGFRSLPADRAKIEAWLDGWLQAS